MTEVTPIKQPHYARYSEAEDAFIMEQINNNDRVFGCIAHALGRPEGSVCSRVSLLRIKGFYIKRRRGVNYNKNVPKTVVFTAKQDEEIDLINQEIDNLDDRFAVVKPVAVALGVGLMTITTIVAAINYFA